MIVNLTRLTENTISVCHRYWPEEGSDLYHIYEVNSLAESFKMTYLVNYIVPFTSMSFIWDTVANWVECSPCNVETVTVRDLEQVMQLLDSMD